MTGSQRQRCGKLSGTSGIIYHTYIIAGARVALYNIMTWVSFIAAPTKVSTSSSSSYSLGTMQYRAFCSYLIKMLSVYRCNQWFTYNKYLNLFRQEGNPGSNIFASECFRRQDTAQLLVRRWREWVWQQLLHSHALQGHYQLCKQKTSA